MATMVSTRGMIDSNKARFDSFNGNTTRETRKGINHNKTPNRTIFTFLFIFNTI